MAEVIQVEPLLVLLKQISEAAKEVQKARKKLYALKSCAHKSLAKFRQECKHERLLHVRSFAYQTEANDCFGSDYIICCHDPRRICLDCGRIEQCRLDERFTDNCSKGKRVCWDRKAEKKAKALHRQSVAADRSARSYQLRGKPMKRITSKELEKIIGHPSYELFDGRLIEPEELYALWNKFGLPKSVT